MYAQLVSHPSHTVHCMSAQERDTNAQRERERERERARERERGREGGKRSVERGGRREASFVIYCATAFVTYFAT